MYLRPYKNGLMLLIMSSHMSSLCARKHRISQWVLIAGELMWGYEKHIFIREYEKLIWKSCMRTHMRICEFLYSWCGMRTHARRTHIRTWETHFFMRRYENSYGNHSWEIILRYANFFTHGAEWEIMPRRIYMRTRENDFLWEGVRNHAPVRMFLSFLKWWHFSKFELCYLIIFFLSPEIKKIFFP